MRKIKLGSKEYEIHYGQNSVCLLEDELPKNDAKPLALAMGM